MTVVTGRVGAYRAGSTSLSFDVDGTTYGIPLDNSAFNPPPATAVQNFDSGVVQAFTIVGAYVVAAPVQFEIDVGNNQTLLTVPPGSVTGDPAVIVKRAYNVQQSHI